MTDIYNGRYQVLLYQTRRKNQLGLFQKKIPGGEEGRRYIFLWVVGAVRFQIIWVIGVRPNQITWVVDISLVEGEERILSAKKREKFYQI